MANNFLATANRVAAHLGKAPKDFTKEDIIRVVQDFDIRMVNLMYPGGDGRLKTLNFMLNSADYLNTILTCGERVDGSSLFSSIEAASSDLYVLPVFRTAFIDPFQEIPTLCLLCDYFDRDGQPLASAPEHTLRKAMQAFHKVTGMEFQAMGELEYYVIKANDPSFPATDQKGLPRDGSLRQGQRLPHALHEAHRRVWRPHQVRPLRGGQLHQGRPLL